MSLENTDKAFAGILDAVKEFSQQVKPDVFNSFSNVAMLSVQGDIISAHVWIFIASIVAVLSIIALVSALIMDTDFMTGFSFFLLIISLIVLGCNITTIYSPLIQGAAADGKIALAMKAMNKMESKQ